MLVQRSCVALCVAGMAHPWPSPARASGLPVGWGQQCQPVCSWAGSQSAAVEHKASSRAQLYNNTYIMMTMSAVIAQSRNFQRMCGYPSIRIGCKGMCMVIRCIVLHNMKQGLGWPSTVVFSPHQDGWYTHQQYSPEQTHSSSLGVTQMTKHDGTHGTRQESNGKQTPE